VKTGLVKTVKKGVKKVEMMKAKKDPHHVVDTIGTTGRAAQKKKMVKNPLLKKYVVTS